MVYKKLSEEEKIIIKYLRQKFGYGAKRIIKNHPEKNWDPRNVGYLLKKIDETGDVKRREGSGRPKSSRTENNINAVKELISSQEDKPGTHATPNEISKMMDIPRVSIRRIIAENLKLQLFKKINGQGIDPRTKEKRIERCPNLLRVFTKQVLETASFSDENNFQDHPTVKCPKRSHLCSECLQEVYNRKQTFVRGTQWLSYEPHGICCRIKSWQIIHFLR